MHETLCQTKAEIPFFGILLKASLGLSFPLECFLEAISFPTESKFHHALFLFPVIISTSDRNNGIELCEREGVL